MTVPRKICLSLLGCVAVLSGFGVGQIVAVRLAAKPTREFGFAVENLSNGGYDTFAKQIAGARTVELCARQVSSETLLTVLRTAAKQGVRIRIVLDGSARPDITRGPIGFLRAYKVGELRLSEKPLFDQFMIVDGQRVFVTSAPWTAAAADPDAASTVIFFRHVGLVEKMQSRFDTVFRAARPVK